MSNPNQRNEKWTAVDQYLSDLFVGHDEPLNAALAASHAAGLPDIHVSPNEGKLLHLLTRIHGARKVLEIGTLGGYSSIWMARALPPAPEGKLVTLEYDPKHAEVARGNIARAGLADVVDIRVGRAIETLPKLLAAGEGPFDLIFLDADKPSNPQYLEWSLRLSRPGTVIVADNVVRSGGVLDAASEDANVVGIRRFNQMFASNPRIVATAIQTVGSKGYDGFAIGLVIS
jgi:predicted O-methyltransferase YrrM